MSQAALFRLDGSSLTPLSVQDAFDDTYSASCNNFVWLRGAPSISPSAIDLAASCALKGPGLTTVGASCCADCAECVQHPFMQLLGQSRTSASCCSMDTAQPRMLASRRRRTCHQADAVDRCSQLAPLSPHHVSYAWQVIHTSNSLNSNDFDQVNATAHSIYYATAAVPRSLSLIAVTQVRFSLQMRGLQTPKFARVRKEGSVLPLPECHRCCPACRSLA